MTQQGETMNHPWMYRKKHSRFITVNGVEMARNIDGTVIERWKLEMDGELPIVPETDCEKFYVN